MGDSPEAETLAPVAEALCTAWVGNLRLENLPSTVLSIDDDGTWYCGTPSRPGVYVPVPVPGPVGPVGPLAETEN